MFLPRIPLFLSLDRDKPSVWSLRLGTRVTYMYSDICVQDVARNDRYLARSACRATRDAAAAAADAEL